MRTVLPIINGKVARVTGYVARKPSLVHCDADGSIEMKPRYGDPYTVALVAGEDRMFEHPLPITAEVKGGTFSFA